MASMLFDITDVNDELPSTGLHSYHFIIKAASIITGITGVVFTVKGVYLKVNVGMLSALPISSQLKHIVNTCVALGILLSFTGIVGITCPTYDGLRLYFFSTCLLFIIELAVSTSLFVLKGELQVGWDFISHFCETCAEPFSEIVNVVTPASGITLGLALSHIFLLYIIRRFLKITEKQGQTPCNNDIQLSICVMTPGSALSRPCSSTPRVVTSHQLGLDLTLTSSPKTGKYLKTPILPRRMCKNSVSVSQASFFLPQKRARINRLNRNFSPLPIPEIVITPASPFIPPSSPSSLHIARNSVPASTAPKQELAGE